MKANLFILFLFACIFATNAQTINSTILQPPCNDDGILVTSVTGLTPPLDFFYYTSGSWTPVIHDNIMALTDTFVGYAAIYVYVTDVNQTTVHMSTGMLPPFYVTHTATHAYCPNPGSAHVTILPNVPPDSVQWYDYNNNNYLFSANPANLYAGQYSVKVFKNGCSIFAIDSSGVYIQNYSGITFSDSITPASCTNGTASVTNIAGGTPPYTFEWSTGAQTQTITNLSKGYYEVTVTDAQACSSDGYMYVNQIPHINVQSTITPATCLQSDGSIIVFGSGGQTPYTYLFSNGSTNQSITGLSGDTLFGVVLTDANGCTGENNYLYVPISTPITVTFTQTPSQCNTPDGSATLHITGGQTPYTVQWLTMPLQTDTIIANMPAGTYPFKVTDANGCIRTGNVVIQPVSSINTTFVRTNAVCPLNNGSIQTTITGTNPPFSFLWNNGSTTPSLSNLAAGVYNCTITDNIGCEFIKTVYIFQTSTINVNPATTPASCVYTADGSININITGGLPPYTSTWSNGMTGPFVTGLPPGNYYVNVSDANGCHYNGYNDHVYLNYNQNNDSCYCSISGRVYADTNGNCLFDTGEQGIHNIHVLCSGFGSTFTNAQGFYEFKVPTGNYTVSEIVQSLYPLAPCQSHIIPANVTAQTGCVLNIDFAHAVNPLHDIGIYPISLAGPPIPGFNYKYGLIVKNQGTVIESNIQTGHRNDGQLNFVSAQPPVLTQQLPLSEPNWYSVITGFPTLQPGQSELLEMTFTVPVNIPLGTLLDFKDTAVWAQPLSNWLSDYSPWNNVANYTPIVAGSYDPNYKEVYPAGEGPQGYITEEDSILTYTIHFQNLGTYYAKDVVITDTLDAALDWNTIEPIYASHEYTTAISNSGVLTFTFNDIFLPWKSLNDITSRGYVLFKARVLPGIANGTVIENTANIYFDFNSPVITNTTINTISTTVSENEYIKGNTLLLYPNPASGTITIVADDTKQISIFDISGRLIYTEMVSDNNPKSINVESFTDGLYIVACTTTDGYQLFARFVKGR